MASQIYSFPIGHGSPSDLVERGLLNIGEAALNCYVWMKRKQESNETGKITINDLSKKLGVHVTTVSRWISSQFSSLIPCEDQNHRARNYYVVSHVVEAGEDIPLDKLGNPKCCWVPVEVLDAFESGKISKQAFFLRCWLQQNSHWTRDKNYGLSRPLRQTEMAKACRMSCENVAKALKELTDAGLIERLTPKNQIGVYQMLPKLKPVDPTKRKSTPKKAAKTGKGHTTKKHTYSDNRQYRICMVTGDIQKRRGKRKWTDIKDRERSLMPEAIRNFFDNLFRSNRQLKMDLQ